MQIIKLLKRVLSLSLIMFYFIGCNAFEVVGKESRNKFIVSEQLSIETAVFFGSWNQGDQGTGFCKSSAAGYIEVQGRNFFGPLFLELSGGGVIVENNIAVIDSHSETSVILKINGNGIAENTQYNIRLYNSKGDETLRSAFTTDTMCL